MTPTTQIAASRKVDNVRVSPIAYRGWSDCYSISNGRVEAIVVPTISRIMQFRFCGEQDGPFWENPALDGIHSTPDPEGWRNYGGDKCWPAPQGDWQRISGHAWPPPLTFDSAPVAVTTTADAVRMDSSVDPHYGIRVSRAIFFSQHSEEMVVTTDFNKIFGHPIAVGVWVVTQLNGLGRVFAQLPKEHSGSAFKQITGPPPQDLKITGRLLSLRRHVAENVKIAVGSGDLLWMDEHHVLRITGHAAGGQHGAVYTNKDPLQYVELETEGPITKLHVGEQISHTNTYTLTRRCSADETEDAVEAFGLKHSLARETRRR